MESRNSSSNGGGWNQAGPFLKSFHVLWLLSLILVTFTKGLLDPIKSSFGQDHVSHWNSYHQLMLSLLFISRLPGFTLFQPKYLYPPNSHQCHYHFGFCPWLRRCYLKSRSCLYIPAMDDLQTLAPDSNIATDGKKDPGLTIYPGL